MPSGPSPGVNGRRLMPPEGVQPLHVERQEHEGSIRTGPSRGPGSRNRRKPIAPLIQPMGASACRLRWPYRLRRSSVASL